MPSTLAETHSLIRDNRKNGKRGTVGEFLAEHIEPQAELSIVSAYFTIYAYHHLRSRLDEIDHLRFLFGEPNFILDRDKEPKIYGIEKDALSIRNKLNQKAVARDCYEWIKEKVEIRSMVKPNFLHGKMYHVQNVGGVRHAISGSSNFTANGLGFGNQPNIELNMVVDSNRDKIDLKAWFDELWHDDSGLVQDVKGEVLKYLQLLYKETDPEFVYLKTLYHVFQSYLEEQGKGGLLNERARVLAQGEFRLYGLRNPQARNYLAQMRAGDRAVFYFERKVWGVMRVNSEAERDATSETGQWLAIAFAPISTFESAIPYQYLKAHPLFAESPLVRQPRLSVVPLTKAQWGAVVGVSRIR